MKVYFERRGEVAVLQVDNPPVNGLNLADRQYFSQAFNCRAGIYPSDGRQLKLSARYDF